MITNWEIASRIDHQTGSLYYTLFMDGTEHDARLIAKKLKGYVTDAVPAQAPYVYAFKLPTDMDEGTQDKIRTAVQEGVDLSNKVNQFVPGGVLGDPLFNAGTSREDKAFPTFLTVAPTTNFFAGNGQEAPRQKPSLDLTDVTHLPGQQIPTQRVPEEAPQVTRVSMGEQPEDAIVHPAPADPQPLELSTTVREVFATIFPKQETVRMPEPAPQTSSVRKEEKPAGTMSITDSDMLIKDMEGSMLEKMPLEDILSAETKYDIFMDVDKTPQENRAAQAQREQHLKAAQPAGEDAFSVFEQELKEQTNVIDVEDVHTITNSLTEKNMDFTKQPTPPGKPEQTPSVPQPETDAFAAEQKTVMPPAVSPAQAQQAAAAVPFTLGAAENGPKGVFSDVSSEDIPEEEVLSATVPPRSNKEAPGADLPEITVREKLDKTFNLETTFNTELIKKQYEKTMSLREGTQPEQEPPHAKTILRLKKPVQSQQPAKPAGTPEEELGKTMLRLRRKTAPANLPQETVQPLRSTMSPQRAAENIRLAKNKAIDHSIQIPVSELKKHNWPLEVPLVPTYTLNNMVMSVNRFAHATAISVIESPGKLYNPLVLHGGTGTGKTHFLNALAYAFSQKFGQEHIFMTNGVRLSRGIQRYVMEGNIEKFEHFMNSVRVLLIDDIHLLAINEQNRAFISKLLNSFLQEQKQIVITSKYPPESLEKLEELIHFKLDGGWISELKPATGATHFRIVKKMLLENGVDLGDKQIETFFGAPQMTLGTVTRSIRRLKVLENLIFPNTPESQISQAGIFEKLLATQGEDATSELINKDPLEITGLSTIGNGEWGRIGFFYPQNCSAMMNWMVYALQQRAKELGIEGGFEIVVRSSYATENIISSAFKIANLCDNKKLKGAVILGPQPNTCDPSVRENFYDILTHMLEIMLIRCGIINYENVRLPSTYVKVISELMR